jgi:hypothetical protein
MPDPYICPRCDETGTKAFRRRMCTGCARIDATARSRRYDVKAGRVDPDRPKGRPKKGAADWSADLSTRMLRVSLRVSP